MVGHGLGLSGKMSDEKARQGDEEEDDFHVMVFSANLLKGLTGRTYLSAMKSQFVLAAAHSGAGKTTVTLGLLRALRRKGYRVQPFKCGPDFIDPIHHHTGAGRSSINLDRYMMTDDHIRDLYAHYGADAEVSITEGVMGLFDGAVKSAGSTADLAKLLGLPVILVLNAKAMAYSAAAILYGLKHFDPAVRIAGVLFNFVETATHYRLLEEACVDAGVPALGFLPANKELRIPSRHLGLDTGDADLAIEVAADHIEKQVDLEALLAITQVEQGQGDVVSGESSASRGEKISGENIIGGQEATRQHKTILIARDAAFHFLYPENIRRLSEWGAVHYFSPLEDERLPVKADLIYLPGGYPELYLDRLAANMALLQQLRDHLSAGGKILAECGGMMYLGRSISDETGRSYPMAGILDISTGMERKKLSLGYRSVQLPGGIARGHEFHYSQYVERGEQDALIDCQAYTARGEPIEVPFFYASGLLASYMHLYWGGEMNFLENWLSRQK
jgi:cobyrinic acid a,c-diamide synthase